MKAIFKLLAALLVSTIPWAAASAQYPPQYAPQYPGYAMPTAYAVPNGPVPNGPVPNGLMANGPVSSGVMSGGCANGDCGKFSMLHKLGLKKDGCGGHGCGGIGGGGLCAALKGWLCRPYPSNAPRFGKPDYPLGFPTHPYLRSPRDYFMMDDP